MLSVVAFLAAASAASAVQTEVRQAGPYVEASGVFPHITMTAESGPERSECGVGAMLPWADSLWVISYLSVPNAGGGTGLYRLDPDMSWTRVMAHNSTYANRMIVPALDSIVIGPYVVDVQGQVSVIDDMLLTVRIGGMAAHLTSNTSVYMLGMDGPLWECDIPNHSCKQLFFLPDTLKMPADEQPHFKAAHSVSGVLYVATNTFFENDYLGKQHGGRLAAYDGSNWTILENTAFQEVTSRFNFGRVVFASGWDDRGAILKVMDAGDAADPTQDASWQTYRIPTSSHTWEHAWTTEWPRIKEIVTERYVLDTQGGFFELAPLGYDGSIFGVRPISTHLRMIPDLAPWRGWLVLGSNQVSSIFDNNLVTGQSQSGLAFIKEDDLWNFGKPQGWGGVWRASPAAAGVPSDPFLFLGYEKRVLHLAVHPPASDAASFRDSVKQLRSKYDARRTAKGMPTGPAVPLGAGDQVSLHVQVDVLGCAGHKGCPLDWVTHTTVQLSQPAAGEAPQYKAITFESGFSAHWVRVVADVDAVVTAQFFYT